MMAVIFIMVMMMDACVDDGYHKDGTLNSDDKFISFM